MKKLFIVLCLLASHSQAQQLFPLMQPDSMQRELHILSGAMASLHPGVFRYQSPTHFDAAVKLALAKSSKPLPENSYLILIAQLLTHLHCGHTYINYWNQPKAVSQVLFSKTYLPYLYRMVGREMIITHNLSSVSALRPGDKVMNINGIPVNRIVDSLLTVSPSDGLHGLARKLDNISILPLDADTSNYNLSDIYFPLFFPRNFNTPLYRLALQHYRSNQTYTATVGALSKKERLIAYKSRFGILPVHEQNWNLRLLKNSTAILRIGDFETWEWKADYKKYLDSIFTLLKERGVKKLVVDIRGNGGGDDEARDKVFSYLTDKPFGCTDPMHRRIRFLTIPDTQLPYLKTWNRSFKEPKKPADYVKYADGLYENKADLQAACQPIQPKAKHFTGQKFLLLDSRNASTTFTMAKLFRNEHIGPLVGEPTSGNQQGINGGQFFFLNLPYSKIEADIPLSWGAYLAKAPDTGIKPDKFIAVTRKSIASGHDTQLDEVIKMAGN